MVQKKIIEQKLEHYEKLYDLTTEEHPIHFSVDTHLETTDSLFDMHYELEIGVVLEGEMQREYDSYSTTVSKGQVWLNSIWEPHGFTLKTAPCKIAIFLFKPDLLTEINLGTGNERNWLLPFFCQVAERPQIPERHRQEVVERLHAIERYSLKEDSHAGFHQKVELLYILHLLLRYHKLDVSQENLQSKSMMAIEPAIKAALNTKDFIPEEQAAELCGMSLRSFTEKFRDAMHISFSKFAQRYRIKNAAQEVLITRKPIKEIAYSWGFTDVSHFYKAFRKYYGQTPSQYRENRTLSM